MILAQFATNLRFRLLAVLLLAVSFSATTHAFDITGWTCNGPGRCGVLGASGDVTAPPAGGPTYGYVTSDSGSISSPAPTSIASPPLVGAIGQDLTFYFNYVTSDGAGFTDYATAALVNLDDNTAAILFTARTSPTGNTVPGQGDPAVVSQLIPTSTPIMPYKTNWAPLGADSGTCWAAGCGSTGWIKAIYNIPKAGNYRLVFTATNDGDGVQHTGLAFAAVAIGAPTPAETSPPVAVPGLSGGAVLALASLMLLVATILRRRNRQTARSDVLDRK